VKEVGETIKHHNELQRVDLFAEKLGATDILPLQTFFDNLIKQEEVDPEKIQEAVDWTLEMEEPVEILEPHDELQRVSLFVELIEIDDDLPLQTFWTLNKFKLPFNGEETGKNSGTQI
jgi:hypothetical protein